jgi:alcohol dehydrogenase class IV
MVETAGAGLATLATFGGPTTALWATTSVRATVQESVPAWPVEQVEEVPAAARALIVAGGGTFIDEAKYYRKVHRPDLRLIAAPSLWGSGAECSPVVVLNRGGHKETHCDPAFLPNDFVYCREILSSVPSALARYACGDTWAHVLEAFFSPLANGLVRSEAAELIREMLALPLATAAEWFSASGRACALQASSSVGLIHGIAHTIEHPLKAAHPDVFWGHSRLCSLFLYPVLALNFEISAKCAELCASYGVDPDAVMETAQNLFELRAYRQALVELKNHWSSVVRNRCTRTNPALVAIRHLDYFANFI